MGKFFNKADQGRESAIPRVYLREYWVADPTTAKGRDSVLKYPGGRRLLRTGDSHILNDIPDSSEGLWPAESLLRRPVAL